MKFLKVLLTIAVFACVLPPAPQQSTEAALSQPTRLILHQMPGQHAITPQVVRDNLAWIEANREFIDGVILTLNDLSAAVMRNTPLDYARVVQALAPVKNLNSATLQYNFALIFSDKCADPFDDWSICIENWRVFARAVKEAGLTGIIFDNEEYFTRWTNYPDSIAYPDKSLAEYEAQTRLRGKQVMEAVKAEFPDIQILFFLSPAVSEPKSPTQIGTLRLANYSQHNELMGPFFAGFVEGMGPQTTLIDGGAQYELRNPAEFEQLYQWRRYGIASDETNSGFISPDIRATWQNRIHFAFGLYNLPWNGRDMTPEIMGPVLFTALNFSDQYVWLYIEQADLLHANGIAQEWIDWMRWGKEQYMSAYEGAVSLQ